MTYYRYLFADLLTNNVIAELPLTGVAFTQQLNQAGTFNARILLSGIDAAGQNVDAATIPGRCAVYVDRDGILVWGGVVWSRNYNSTSQTLTLGAREFESYFERRRITSTQAFTNTDQLTIVQTLMNNAQAAPSGNIGVVVGSNTSGVLVDRVYYDYELKSVHGAIMDLSRAENGFDYRIKVQYDGAFQPEKQLLLGYPRLGTVYSPTATNVPFFEFPAGNVVEYEYPEDGAIAANTVYALGAGSNEGKLIASASDSTLLAAGWPLLEEQANYSDVTDAGLLAELAQGQVLAVSYPPTTIKMVVPAFVEPVFGTYQIGDDARVRITDDRFPQGLDAIYRIVGISVEPGEDGPERVTLTLTTTTN